MANLPETPVWETGIYQLEETDPVQGGPNGIDNQQGKQLANRTRYLKGLVESLGTGKLDLAALATQAEAIAGTDNTKWMTPLRVAQAIVALASMATATETTAGKVELATVAETVTGTDTDRATHPAGVKAAINAAVAALIGSSQSTLDTLNELGAALGNDPNFATTITALIAGKLSTSGGSMSGALSLYAGSIAPTPPRFDNGLSLSTTEFVNRLGVNFPREGGIPISTPSSITADQAGRWFDVHANVTLSLPPLSTVRHGAAFSFRSVSGFTLAGNGAEPIVHQNSITLVNTYPTLIGETTTIVSNGAAWYIVSSGFGAPSYASLHGTNGYRKLPGGDIEQWGYVTESAHATDYRGFTIPFPNNCFNLVLSPDIATPGGLGANFGTAHQIIDRTKFLLTVGGNYGGGGVVFYRAIGN